MGSSTEILEEIVQILGVPPESFHSFWRKEGINIAGHAQLDKNALKDRIQGIGIYDQDPSARDGNAAFLKYHPLLESSGSGITRDETIGLEDLLRRTLDYSPEKRLSADKLANHSWFAYGE